MKETLHRCGRVCRLSWQYQPSFLIWTAASNLLEAVYPYAGIYFAARIIGVLTGSREASRLWFWVLLTLAVTAGLGLLKALCRQRREAEESLFWSKFADPMMADKRLSMDYPDAVSKETQGLHDQIRQLTNYSGYGASMVLGEILPKLLRHGVSILSAVVLSAGLFLSPVRDPGWKWLDNPLLMLALLACMLLVAWLTGTLTGKASQRFSEEADKGRFGNRLCTYFLSGIHDAQGSRLDMRLYDQYPISLDYLEKWNPFAPKGSLHRLMCRYMAPLDSLAAAINVSFIAVAYLFVCLKAWAGAFGIDGVSQYVGAITAMAGSISGLTETVGNLKANSTALDWLFRYLDIPNAMYQGSLTTEKRADRCYNVEFRDVSFRYPGTEVWALRHVNMKFKVGSRMAVVGENGSGKTTFIKLLCRLYDPTEGQILLNGIDIRKYRYDDYMGIFSVVFQDFKLPAYTLAQAVAAGRPMDRIRIRQCLEMAGFGPRLAALPKGLDTMLYKDLHKEGVEVSGGEAQKIAIARTLYKDAPFLILDEPTAALDPRAEAEIYEKFNEIAGDKTAVYISHRLSSCKFCDEIAVFDHGQILQQGTHEELVETEGKYQQLWNAQAQYYTES